MEQEQLFKGRDKRKKGWFWLDNEYLNGYAKLFGAVGTAIYVSLCRHADNETQRCFPAQSTIAEELGITSRTVRRYLKLFEKHHLISIKKERNPETQEWLNNTYTLLDKSQWDKPEEIVSYGEPEETNDTSHRKMTTGAIGHQRPINKTHINKTHINKTHIEDQPPLNENQNSSLKDKPTPSEIAREFFENPEFRNQFIKRLIDSGEYGDEREVVSEVSRFFDYWTEKNKSGTKQRWELEKTFEIGKRLKTWFNNAKNWQKRDNNEVEFII